MEKGWRRLRFVTCYAVTELAKTRAAIIDKAATVGNNFWALRLSRLLASALYVPMASKNTYMLAENGSSEGLGTSIGLSRAFKINRLLIPTYLN